MTTAIITAPVAIRTGLKVRRQISVIEKGVQVWRDADDDGGLAALLERGESATVDIANSHQRLIVELTTDVRPIEGTACAAGCGRAATRKIYGFPYCDIHRTIEG